MAINKKFGEVVEFSKFSEYLCHVNSNGILKLWEPSSSVLRQEYVSSEHLSSRCHCVAWCPVHPSNIAKETPKKKRKRTSSNQDSIGHLQLVAMGTTSGSILLYSVKKGDLHKTLSGGHEECVVDICWSQKGDRLFSCSRDGLVVCWDVHEACIESKWNTGTSLSSMHLCASQDHLLTAGRCIQVWHINSKSLLQTFQGHTTDVLKMADVSYSENPLMNGGGSDCDDHNNNKNNNNNNNNNSDDDDDDEQKLCGIKDSYIFSMAAAENKISVRKVSNKELLASFSLSDTPVHFHLIHTNKQLLHMVVVTRGGTLAYFECLLHGHHRKPIKAKVVTRVITGDVKTGGVSMNGKAGKNKDTTNNCASNTLPILTAKLVQGAGLEAGDGGSGLVVSVLYGDLLKPAFERINVSDLKETLVRSDPRACKVSVEESVVKIKTPSVENDVLLLTSSSVQACKRDGNDDVKPSRKRKKSFSQSQEELTLGDQLSLMSKKSSQEAAKANLMQSPSATKESLASNATPLSATQNAFTAIKTSTTSAKTDSLAMLLTQGLQSGDKKILNNVLQKSDFMVVRNTVAKLPPQCIHPLVKELSRRISGHAQRCGFSMLSDSSSNKPPPSQAPLSTIGPIDDDDNDDDDLMAEDVRHLEISDEDEWEDEPERVVTNTKDSKSSHKTSDLSEGEGSADETLMEAD